MVERSAVKLFRVVDPLTRRLEEVTVPDDVTFPAFRFDAERLVELAFVAKKLVVVALVPVARVKVKAWRVDEPVASKFDELNVPERARLPPVAVVKKRFVVEPVVAKKLVVVAFVLVLFCAVKFWRVDDPRVRMFANVPTPVEVIDPPLALVKKRDVLDAVFERRVPRLALAENRFVELAVVAKKLVVVAEVPVALVKVKFFRVDEPVARKFEPVTVPDDVMFPPFINDPKRLVEDAVVAKIEVEVAFVVVELRAVKFWRVEEPETRRLANDPSPVEVKAPDVKLVADRLVKAPVVAKKLVEVELVDVELSAVKF